MEDELSQWREGAAAALMCPLALVLGFYIMGNHWRGSALMLNCFKNSLGTVLFLIMSAYTRSSVAAGVGGGGEGGGFWPANPWVVTMLVVSAVIGIVVGDNVWLHALLLIGPRRVILVDSIKPFVAEVLAILILGERGNVRLYMGMVCTMAGVTLVALEKKQGPASDTGDADAGAEMGERKQAGGGGGGGGDLQDKKDRGDEEQGQVSGVEASSIQGKGKGQGVGAEVETDKVGDGDASEDVMRRGYAYAVINVVLDTYGAVLVKQHAG